MQTLSCRLVNVVFLLIGLFVLGCGETEKKYIPSENTARGALEAALNAWKSGNAHGTVKSFEVPIDTFDARWQTGKKLEQFEVLREEPTTDGPKKFIVKMKLDGEEEKEVTYLIVGKDPLLVFREEDYNKASGMGG